MSQTNEQREFDAFAAYSTAAVVQQPKHLIIPPAWHTLTQQINHVAQFGGGIHVVSGQPGAGKSTFVPLLLQKISVDELKCTICVGENDGPEVVLGKLLISLGLHVEKGVTLGAAIVQLRSYVQSLRAQKQRAIVVIDDGHYIDEALLAGLTSVLQGDGDEGFGLHFIFLSEPGLAERMDNMRLVDVTVHDSELPAFASSEIFELFYKHFEADSLDAGLPISNDDINLIWSRAKGLPGPALELANERLHEKQEAAVERETLPVMHIVSIVVLVVALVVLILWQKPEFLGLSQSVVMPAAEPQSSLVDSRPGKAKTNLEEVVRAEIKPFRVSDQGVPPATADVKSDEKTSDINRSEQPSGPGNADQQRSDEVLVVTVSDVSASRGELAIVSEPETEGLTGKVQASSSSTDTKLPVNVTTSNQDLEVGGRAVSSATIPEVALEVTKPAQELAGKKAVVTENQLLDVALDGEKALLKLDSRGYVLQVMAASSEEALLDYKNRQSNRENLTIYRGERGGKPWYMVVEGFYADRGSALAAIQNLPSRQRRNRPWPKPIADVQAEIRDYLDVHGGIASGHHANF